jgi:hypothetical protein
MYDEFRHDVPKMSATLSSRHVDEEMATGSDRTSYAFRLLLEQGFEVVR